MRKWGSFVLLLLAIVIGSVWIFRILFPPAETVIRKRLVEMARLVSFQANEGPLAKLTNPQQLATYLTPNVEISMDVPGRGQQSFGGREEIIQAATAARSQLSSLTVGFPDITVLVAAGTTTAVADVTVRANIGGERDVYIQEMKFSLEKSGGVWMINRIETVKTLR